MLRCGSLVLAASLLGACMATPITLPFNDGATAASPDSRELNDAGAMDSYTNKKDDLSWSMDAAAGMDASADAASADAAADALCLECPLPDGATDAGAGDAEAGPSADALPDLAGDLLVGE